MTSFFGFWHLICIVHAWMGWSYLVMVWCFTIGNSQADLFFQKKTNKLFVTIKDLLFSLMAKLALYLSICIPKMSLFYASYSTLFYVIASWAKPSCGWDHSTFRSWVISESFLLFSLDFLLHISLRIYFLLNVTKIF